MTLKCSVVIRSLMSMVVLLTTTFHASAQVDSRRVEAVAGLLEELIETYGVSGDEQRVRAVVERHLPAWAKPRVDESAHRVAGDCSEEAAESDSQQVLHRGRSRVV